MYSLKTTPLEIAVMFHLECSDLGLGEWVSEILSLILKDSSSCLTLNICSLSLGLALLLNPQLGSAYQLMCYYNNVAQNRPKLGSFNPADIDPCLCTHLIYAFAGMRNNKVTMRSMNDLTDYQALNTLKSRSENSKAVNLLSLGSIVDTY